jgi:hypothetical protein
LIADDTIGPPRSIRWRTLRTQPAIAVAPTAARTGGSIRRSGRRGHPVDHGWHALYCVVRWGGAPRAIAATLEKRRFLNGRSSTRRPFFDKSGTAEPI